MLATTSATPVATAPAVVAAVVRYERGARHWKIGVEELHALDAAYVAGCAVSAWAEVARERQFSPAGATATAKLSEDGITWLIHVLTTQRDAEDAHARLQDLLGELRAPIDIWVEVALPEDDGNGDPAIEAHPDRDGEPGDRGD